jgi:ribosome-binding ATPase YchF (GTP1/OBG family)
MTWIGTYLHRQRDWSSEIFGTTRRTVGICAHIEKELSEIQDDPDDVREWIDVMILALDGYWRHGGKPEDLAEMLEAKQRVNFERSWPAVQPDHMPTEHLR